MGSAPPATRYGVCPESLRVWERQGLIPPALRTMGGHRRYRQEHVRVLDKLMGMPVGAQAEADARHDG